MIRLKILDENLLELTICAILKLYMSFFPHIFALKEIGTNLVLRCLKLFLCECNAGSSLELGTLEVDCVLWVSVTVSQDQVSLEPRRSYHTI